MPNPMSLTETGLTGGLQQRVSEPLLPFGEFTIAQNVRQTKNGWLAKRPGNVKLTNQYQQLYNFGAASLDVTKGAALSSFGSQLLLSCNAGTACYSEAHGTFGTFKPGNEALLTRQGAPVPSAINANTKVTFGMAPTFITDGTHNFYVWVSSAGSLFTTITNVASGSLIQDRVGIEPGVTNILWAVPLMLGTQLTIVYLKSTGALLMATLASPYTGSFSASVTLNTGVGVGANFDAVAIAPNLFAVIEPAGTTTIVLKTFDAAGNPVGSSSTIAVTAPKELRITKAASPSTNVWIGWRNAANTISVQTYSTLGASLTSAMTGPFQVQATLGASFHMVAYAANQAAVVLSRTDFSMRAGLVDSTLSGNAGGFVIDSASDAAQQGLLASKPFLQDGRVYCWSQQWTYANNNQPVVTEYGLSNAQQFTNVLVDLRLDTGTTGTTRPMRPVAVDSPRFAYPVPSQIVSDAGVNLGAFVAPLGIVQTSANVWTALFGVRQTAYETAWATVDASFSSVVRWRSGTLGGLTLLSSGMLLNWDGSRAQENGFLNHVVAPTLTPGTGGTLTASATYNYRVVPVTVDAAGNVHRGIPSPLTSVTLSSSQHQVTLTFPGYAVTDRWFQDGSTVANAYETYWEIYRSQANAASTGTDVATNFVDIVANAFTTVSYTDGIADSTVAKNALCYTFGGALPNGCPPGAWDICVHLGRVWLIADDRATLYFSKQVVDGEGVNFTDSFTMPADPANARALASMDDKLVIFTDTAIFYNVGNGPGDNGQGSDYAGFQPIQSDVGCIDRRSVVSTDVGVFFQSPIGIHLLDRGLQVQYIGQPIADELATYPVIVASALHPTQPWVYFYVTNAAGNAGERLVYDYRVQRWYTDTLPGVPVSATNTAARTHYWLDTTGQVWSESTATNLDNGAWVTADFESVQHATGIDGWQSIGRLQVLFSRKTPHDLQVRTRPMYGTVYDTPVSYWNDVAMNAMQDFAGGAGTRVEIVPRSSKVNALAIRVTDAAPTGGAALGTGQGAIFYALALTTEPLPATMALATDPQRG